MKHLFSNSLLFTAFASMTTAQAQTRPNIVFVFADQWREQSVGYNGNKDVLTPNLDKLAKQSINVVNMISCCPISTPYRGSMLTGQYPLTTGLFRNDVSLNPEATTIGDVYEAAGYNTAYVGKWHVNGGDRTAFIPKERRHGFDYWKVNECTHDYNDSYYWDNNDKFSKWEGYDAYAQTADVINYIQDHKQSSKPFIVILSWGPPHTVFKTAPTSQQQKYAKVNFNIRPNVPKGDVAKAKKDLIGYYGHMSALDSCIGMLQEAIKKYGLEKNTIFVFSADHGEMLSSHDMVHKQVPFEESINVPMLIKYPALFGKNGRTTDMLMNAPDIMPTLLGMSNIPIPSSVEGDNKTSILKGDAEDTTQGELIASYVPFKQTSELYPGKEYRGVRTKRYTYVKDLKGPWLFFDNLKDPYQMNNLVNDAKYEKEKNEMEVILNQLLKKTHDEFLTGIEYNKKWDIIRKSYTPLKMTKSEKPAKNKKNKKNKEEDSE